ncbi:GLPGLI family protein [Zunongwangia sp. SCSIO 43204]|uniref:GLPGLI family protein n=1 Tax=Zunongwangia sp. SCSIO 43204 TaxID=2779359 RepID=UPI001CA9BC6C|nr:GLPGLI family protein [Zunongwangia sp. SCSIO 43204]UAB85391.1 GLPGLI family protein [Zunongwangia sp. SCSIO 43204]
MKYLIFILALISGSFSFGQNVGGEVTYKKAFSEHGKSENPNVAARMAQAAKIMKGLDYKLMFNSKESHFSLEETMENDGSGGYAMAVRVGGGKGGYFKNNSEAFTIHSQELFGNDYLVKIPTGKYEWKLTKESKTILGYNCFKAVCTIKMDHPMGKNQGKSIDVSFEAYYAPSLSFSFGPAAFNGLPGLILEASEGSVTYKAVSIDLTHHLDTLPNISIPSKGKVITEEQLNKEVREMMVKMRNNKI